MRAQILVLKLVLVTLAAMGAAYYAIGSVNISGIMSNNFIAADVIRERCPIHLVRPEWVAGKDQEDILLSWPIVEMKTRLATLLVLWMLSVTVFVWRYPRRRTDGQKA
jgi:hypothetical protein